MNDLKVSIITPSFNQGRFVEETIKSVLNQTYANIEYIFVDGGSSDETMKIVEKYNDRISIIISEKDNGQADAINKGFKLASGDLVGWINSDDVLYPSCVEKIVNLYKEHSEGVIFYSSVIDIIDIKGEFLRKYNVDIPNRDSLLFKNYNVAQQGSFYKRLDVEAVGGLGDNHYCMDLDLWLRLLNRGAIYSEKDVCLAAFRDGDYTKTANGGIFFLRDIRKTLLKNGAKTYSRTVIATYWKVFKLKLKHKLFQ